MVEIAEHGDRTIDARRFAQAGLDEQPSLGVDFGDLAEVADALDEFAHGRVRGRGLAQFGFLFEPHWHRIHEYRFASQAGDVDLAAVFAVLEHGAMGVRDLQPALVVDLGRFVPSEGFLLHSGPEISTGMV